MNLLVYEEPKIDDGKEQKSKDIVTSFIHFHDTIQYHLSKYCPSQNWILILVHWGISCAAVVPKNGLDLDYCWIIVPLNMKGGISEIPQHFYFKKKKKKWIKEWEKLCFYLLIAREGMNRKDLLYLSWIPSEWYKNYGLKNSCTTTFPKGTQGSGSFFILCY